MKVLISILVAFSMLSGCTKDKNKNPDIVLNGVLTNCQPNTNCTYDYYDNADVVNGGQPVQGKYRLFIYNSVNTNMCNATDRLYFKISMGNNSFDIGSSQIAAGQIIADENICPCCAIAASLSTKAIGGKIKGKRTDATHWLVNASVVIGAAFNNVPIDTLVVNQYFTLQKTP